MMIRKLRKRTSVDVITGESRRQQGALGRRLYSGLLVVGALALANLLVGHTVFLRADGLVVQERMVVSSTFLAQVSDLSVREGERVKAGEQLALLESPEMIDRLAALSSREGDLIAELANLQVKSRELAAVLPVATDRAEATGKRVQDYKRLRSRGLVTATAQDDAYEASFEAQQSLVALRGELSSLTEQREAIERARAETRLAIDRLRAHYADGLVVAPVDGTIGSALPPPGLVIRPGDPLLTLHYGLPHIVAFVPNNYLFRVKPGQRVSVKAGPRRTIGVVDSILPLAEALPPEFQRTFRPRDRHHLIRLRLVEPEAFPLNEKVRLGNCWFFCGTEPAPAGPLQEERRALLD